MKNLMFFTQTHTHFYTHDYTQGFFAELGCLLLQVIYTCNCLILFCFPIVPRAGLEPAQTQCLQDFKSCVSTNSTTRAKRAKDGSRTRDLNLGKVALYQLSYFRIILLSNELFRVANIFIFFTPRENRKFYSIKHMYIDQTSFFVFPNCFSPFESIISAFLSAPVLPSFDSLNDSTPL